MGGAGAKQGRIKVVARALSRREPEDIAECIGSVPECKSMQDIYNMFCEIKKELKESEKKSR